MNFGIGHPTCGVQLILVIHLKPSGGQDPTFVDTVLFSLRSKDFMVWGLMNSRTLMDRSSVPRWFGLHTKFADIQTEIDEIIIKSCIFH